MVNNTLSFQDKIELAPQGHIFNMKTNAFFLKFTTPTLIRK